MLARQNALRARSRLQVPSFSFGVDSGTVPEFWRKFLKLKENSWGWHQTPPPASQQEPMHTRQRSGGQVVRRHFARPHSQNGFQSQPEREQKDSYAEDQQ